MVLSRRTVRSLALKVIGPSAAGYIRKHFRPHLVSVSEYRMKMQGMKGLEIGGPSQVLASDGPLPLYDVFDSLDNCLYSAQTIWTGDVFVDSAFRYHPQKKPGKQFICEATSLVTPCTNYDCVIASHCLEHLANPLLALTEWRRVLKQDGILLLVLPHKDGTFDWRRRVTPLSHMIEDYENNVGEDDLTHLEEILSLHDLQRDPGAGTIEAFRERCQANYKYRAIHHHVFNTLTALELVNHAGFRILRADCLLPFHIFVLASRDSEVPTRQLPLDTLQVLATSPFRSDRVLSRRFA